MSIKKLFESTNKVQEFVSNANVKDTYSGVIESYENIEAKKEDQERYTPQIDFSKPENFAKYGSARLYYKSALTRITDFYPYDGSEAEKNQFLNGCLDIERYILDNEYPRTTGYIELGRTYNVSTITDGYGVPTTDEYIDFFGGPGTGSSTSLKLKDLMPNPKDNKYNYSNIYDESIYTTAKLPTDYGKGTRTSNLRSNFDDGVTVEFWLKTGSVNPTTLTSKQVVYDMWNGATDETEARFTIELTCSHGASADALRPFLLTFQSGSHTTKDFLSLGKADLHSSSGDWNHYAIRAFNTGSNFKAQLYVNGQLNDTAIRMPYDLASSVKPTTDGVRGWLSSSAGQERSWPHAIENTYSSANNLQGWWRLNEDISTDGTGDAIDSSGNGRHGTFSDPAYRPAFAAGIGNFPSAYITTTVGSCDFDGAASSGDDQINIGTVSTWNALIGNGTAGTSVMTFSAWINPDSAGESDNGRILDFSSGDVRFNLQKSGSKFTLRFRTKWASGCVWTTTATFDFGQWYHVAATYDANSADNDPKIYVNGVLQAVSEGGTAPSGDWEGISGTHACYIGNDHNRANTFDGKICDVAVWNSILLESEIKAIYSAYTIQRVVHTVGELGPKNLKGRIGALIEPPAGSSAPAKSGRLKGSLDEFRFWKTARSSKDIGTNWFTQVRGGANSDISNTTLGVYYKFNEGITGDTNTDDVVLDYAGRVTNGVWTGYSAGARNTGSAIVSASAAAKEFRDPIIRTNHPDYINLESRLLDSGSYHDYSNNTAFLKLVPSWILDDSDETDNTDLRYISHVMGVYFDKLYAQIKDLPKLRHATHTSGSFKPISFAEHLPQSLGLYSPEIFIDSTVTEKFMNQSEHSSFENDLAEAKNLIYQNLYNNLTEIYKSKGTEQAIRNVLKCFNINDNLLALKINSNNTEFILKNNLENQLLSKNCINFDTRENANAVVYQMNKPYPGIASGDILGYVTGSSAQYGYGFTLESNVIFPYFDSSLSKNERLSALYNQMSLFGTVTVDGTDSASKLGTDTTAVASSADFGNFKVYFVRESTNSRNGYFKLVAAQPGGDNIVLTSSVFKEVYNNEAWNLSVRVRPEDYPLQTFVSGNITDLEEDKKNKYDVIFSGYNAKTTDLFDSFIVTSSVDTVMGKKYIESAKRAYVGADRVNVTGDVSYKSDVLVSSLAYWLKALEDTDLQQHALDLENVGLSGSGQSLFSLGTHTGPYGTNRSLFVENLARNTLALNWNFRNVTGSDASGDLVVQDFSSGSAQTREKFGWTGTISGYHYIGRGAHFKVSSTSPAKKQRINTYKFVDPERPVSSDMVQIYSDADDLTPNLRRKEIVPNFVYSLEKSMYNAISEEILDFFAGVIDFNDIVGHPVHYYRERYKGMEKLRQAFFERVTEVSTVEKYTEYYKWFDNALTTIISQLVPASSEYINDIQNVVESHVLERNKYQNRLNILDSNKFTIDMLIPDPPPIIGYSALADSTLESSTSEERSPRPTNIHLDFWKKRADRTAREITSGDATIDAQRNTIRDIIWSDPITSGSVPVVTFRNIDGTTYTRRSFTRKSFASTYKLNVAMEDHQYGKKLNKEKILTRNIRGGVNFESAKDFDFAASVVRPGGPINHDRGVIVPLNVMLGFVSESVDLTQFGKETRPTEQILKRKKTFKVNTGRDFEAGLGYKNIKSEKAFPFNVYSASVEVSSGYNSQVVSLVDRNIMITNLHNDVYGDHQEKPLQGPFTNNVVGGHQSRHIKLNSGTDQQNNRAEAWRILLGTCDAVPSGAIGVVGPDYPPANAPLMSKPYPYPYHEKAYLYRDHIAKRPVNIKNINRLQNNKTVPGNFQEQYEVIHSFGAFRNPRAFLDNQPTLPTELSQVDSTTNVRTLLSIKRTTNGHVDPVGEYSADYLNNTNNKTIGINRFSSPGGIETMTKGYQDFKSSEMSVYNSIPYRNLTVIRPYQGPSGTVSKVAINGDTTNIQVADIHNKDYGLRSHLARHSARFGRDSVFVTNPGTSYSELPSFHKINRNRRQIIKSANENNTNFITSSIFDNEFVIHPIPRSDRQYRWLSSAVLNSGDIRYADYQSTQRGAIYETADVNEMGPFRTSSAGLEHYWTFVSRSDATILDTEGHTHAQPTNNLNIIINDPISSSTNTRGYPSGVTGSMYTNPYLIGTPNPNYLNHLLASRGLTYGWGWNKFHQSDDKILVNERKANELTIATGSTEELTTFALRPLSMKGRESFINFDTVVPDGMSIMRENVTLKFTNTNEKIFFNELSLNNYFEIDYDFVDEPYRDAIRLANSEFNSLNWFLYKQNIFPSLKNEFGTTSTKRVGYDNKFWRDSRTARGVLGNTLKSSMIGATVSKSAWVLDAPENFSTRSSIPGSSGSATIKFPTMQYFTSSVFTPLTGVAGYNITVPAGGELQNTYYSYFTVNLEGAKYATQQLAPLYARKHALGIHTSVVSPGGVMVAETSSMAISGNFYPWNLTKQIKPFAGEALWEAGEQAGIVVSTATSSADELLLRGVTSRFLPSASSPWYNDYDKFNEEFKLLAKGYAVVPEYRMSEHVNDYFRFGINNKSKQNMFEIVGTPSSSADKNFYIDYSNSDFLENFLGIKKASLLNAKEIKLTCHAAVKYNPYNGFYPAQRTVDLSKQFAVSFKDSINGSIDGITSGITPFTNKTFGHDLTIYQRAAGVAKPAFDPLISPGILFNSIKAGMAVDYPIVSNHRKRLRRPYGVGMIDAAASGSTNNWALSITGSGTEAMILSGASGQYLGGQYWDKRVPFEAIIEPRKYILDTIFTDLESHPSMSLDWNWSQYDASDLDDVYEKEAFTASFGDNADGVYSLMARNFFGACGEFFLKDSAITKLESNTVLNDLQFDKDPNFGGSRPLFMARVKLRKSHNGARTYEKEFDSYSNVGSGSGPPSYYGVNGAKRTQNGTASAGTYALPQDPMRNDKFKETFTMYSRPTAFGPPCAGRPHGINANQMPFLSASRDSFSGFNPGFTPPYYDGEAWADLIFRPHVLNRDVNPDATAEVYDLNRILNETQVVCWRFDAGELRQVGPAASHAKQPVLLPIAQSQNITFAFGSDTKTLYGAGSGSAPAGTGSAVNYIKLYNGNTRYNVWFSASAGDLAPAASLHPGTAVLVDITSGGSSSAAHYADKFKTVINALSDFTATVDGTEVTVSYAYVGNAAEAAKEGTISPITISYSEPSYVSPNNDKTVPSIYDGKRINANSMQLTSSVKIFGTEKVLEQETDKFGNVIKNTNKPVGSKWIIQPKWETPMLNFNDEGTHPITAENNTLTVTRADGTPIYGAEAIPRGMWHQFGVIPDDPNKGVFLEITDIPEDWLRNHYQVIGDQSTQYNIGLTSGSADSVKKINLYKHVRSLSSLCGFDQTNSTVKLGQLKESAVVHEAIVAIPYVIDEVEESLRKELPEDSKFKTTRKKFISIPKRRFGATREEAAGSAMGDSLGVAGESIRKLKQNMEKYVFPPEFDFLNNKEVDPIAMYVFEFKYEFDRDDLSYIWQNLAPRDSRKLSFQEASVSHNLANNELINEEVLNNEHLRWMVFKVKQRAQTDYYDLIPDQANESTRQVEQKTTKLDKYKFGFNWPYDYLSFVELIKMDVDILLKK